MSHMAGHASTAGVWPAMSTNVVHMAELCGRNGPCGKERRNSQSSLPVSMLPPNSRHSVSATTLHNSRQNHLESCSVTALFIIGMGI